MTHALLALALAATPMPPAEAGIPALAGSLAAAIAARFEVLDGRIVRADPERVFVDLPLLADGTELEWLVAEAPLLDPDELVQVGELRRACGTIRVRGANGSVSWGRPEAREGCAPPAPGDPVRLAPQALAVSFAAGASDPAVAGLARLLAEVVPERLHRTGRFAAAASPAEAALRVEVRAARRAAGIAVLAELAAVRPRPFTDVVAFEIPALPEALWRGREEGGPSGRELDAATLPGTALAARSARDGWPALVLADRALVAVTVDAADRLNLEPLVDLAALPRAPSPPRVPGGTLAGAGAHPAGSVCFATTGLARAWCLEGGRLVPFDGVPVEVGDRIVAAAWVAGTNLLDLALPGGAGRLGPALAVTADRRGGALVLRPGGALERVSAQLAPVETVAALAGDAFDEVGLGTLVASGAGARGEPDRLVLGDTDGHERALPIAGSAAAVAVARDAGGAAVLVVATDEGTGSFRLAAYRP